MNEYDSALDSFLKLWESCEGDDEALYRLALETRGYKKGDVDWIRTVVGSALFRAAYSKVLASHTTDFEDDPWFLAAQRRFPAGQET